MDFICVLFGVGILIEVLFIVGDIGIYFEVGGVIVMSIVCWCGIV